MNKKIITINVFLTVFLMISTVTAVNITNSEVVEKNIALHTIKIENTLDLNTNKITGLEDQDFEGKEFMILLFNQIINDEIDKDYEKIVEELENNFDESDVDYFTDSVDLFYDEEYIQQLLESVEQAFKNYNFEPLINICNSFRDTEEFNDLYELLSDKEDYVEAYELIKDEDKLSTFFNNVKNDPKLEEKFGLLEFWFAWIITWAILVVDFFSEKRPIIYNMMGTFPMIVLFFPRTYWLFLVAFVKVAIDYFSDSKTKTRNTTVIDLFSKLQIDRFHFFEKILKKICKNII